MQESGFLLFARKCRNRAFSSFLKNPTQAKGQGSTLGRVTQTSPTLPGVLPGYPPPCTTLPVLHRLGTPRQGTVHHGRVRCRDGDSSDVPLTRAITESDIPDTAVTVAGQKVREEPFFKAGKPESGPDEQERQPGPPSASRRVTNYSHFLHFLAILAILSDSLSLARSPPVCLSEPARRELTRGRN